MVVGRVDDDNRRVKVHLHPRKSSVVVRPTPVNTKHKPLQTAPFTATIKHPLPSVYQYVRQRHCRQLFVIYYQIVGI